MLPSRIVKAADGNPRYVLCRKDEKRQMIVFAELTWGFVQYEDPPRDWEEEDRLDENDDTYYFVPCLDLASTSAAKRAEADKWMHRDWRHNTEWWHLVRIFHDHSSGFFVEPSILAQLKAFHRQVVAESAVSQQQPRPSPPQTDLVVTSMQLSSQTLPKSRLQDAHEVKVRTELDIPIETREEHVNEAAEGSTGLENAMSDLVRSTNMATLSTAPGGSSSLKFWRFLKAEAEFLSEFDGSRSLSTKETSILPPSRSQFSRGTWLAAVAETLSTCIP